MHRPGYRWPSGQPEWLLVGQNVVRQGRFWPMAQRWYPPLLHREHSRIMRAAQAPERDRSHRLSGRSALSPSQLQRILMRAFWGAAEPICADHKP